MSATSTVKCWGARTLFLPANHQTTPFKDSQHKVTATCAPRHSTKSALHFHTRELIKSPETLSLRQTKIHSRKSIHLACAADGAQSAPAREKVQPSPGGSAGEDGMSADLRHMREAGPIGDSAAGVAGTVGSAEDLEAADETAEEVGSPAKTALASDYGPGASALNPGVNSAGEIDYSKASVQPGARPPSAAASAAPRGRDSPVQETDTAPAAQGFSGQENGFKHEAMAENFEAQATRQPEALSDQVDKAPGSGMDTSGSAAESSGGVERTSEGNVSLVPDEDLAGSKSTGQEEKRTGGKDLNDAVGPTHQAL